jgi:hypothetical protein
MLRAVRASLVGLLIIASLAAACGSPDGREREFLFTPTPYEWIRGVPVSTNGRTPYHAGEVLAVVKASRIVAFEEWAGSLGFQVLEEHRSTLKDEEVRVLLEVPLGSVVDAIKLMENRNEVVGALPNFIIDPTQATATGRVLLRRTSISPR